MQPFTFEDLQGNTPGEGKQIATSSGGEDFLGKINSIVTGVNRLFDSYIQLQERLKGQPGTAIGKVAPPADQGDVVKLVDQRLLSLVTQTFANKALNIPIKELISDYGELTMVEAMEKAATEGE